jgi:hypothetical protein
MRKTISLVIFSLIFSLLPQAGLKAAATLNITSNDAPAITIYPSEFDKLVMDFTIKRSDNAEGVLRAFTFENTGNARNYYDISKVVVWRDAGEVGFQGMEVDEKWGEATYRDSGNYWQMSGLNKVVPSSGLRIFVSVETAAKGSAITGKFIQMRLSGLSDNGTKNQFDEGDRGVFLDGVSGPTEAILNSGIQTIYVSSTDISAPKTVIKTPQANETIAATSYKITGATRDQGGSNPSQVKISITKSGGAEGQFTDVTGIGANFSTWEYNWASIAEGTYTIKAYAIDWIGNTETVGDGIIVTVNQSALNSASSSLSTVDVSKSYLLADGIDKVTVTVTVKNAYGTLLSGKTVSLSTGRLEDSIKTVKETTSGDGLATFEVSSISAGTSTLRAQVGSIELDQKPILIFSPVSIKAGNLIKGSGASVYFLSQNGKKYLFPTSAIYSSWYNRDYSQIKTISNNELNSKPLGGNVTVRPSKLVQFVSMDTPWKIMDSKVYAVASGGKLHWLKTAQVAVSIFGLNWEREIVATPEIFKTNYSFGADISAYGDFNLTSAKAVNSIDENDAGLYSFKTSLVKITAMQSGDLVKGSGSAVYYYGADGKKYLFPTKAIFSSWYANYNSVKTVTAAELNSKSLGGNVTVRPSKLIQFVSMDTPWRIMDNKVYAVSSGGNLQWIKTAAVAKAIFGNNWESQIAAVPEVFKTNYKFGTDISSVSNYSLSAQQAIATINQDKSLSSSSSGGTVATGLIQPSDLVYQGAFRLPDGSNGTSWEYSGTAATYYPSGDASGANDGYPGSLFATGHEWEQQVSEISIPVPIKSRNVNDLNTATTIQPFHSIKGSLFGSLELPRVGLAYLPKQGSQSTDKLYFCWAQHLDEGNLGASHGWAELNLSSPNPKGPWRISGEEQYVTSDYIFEIPEDWAVKYTPGKRLITGRYRDGGQGGQGPSLFAIGPWNQGNPPAANTSLVNTPLLKYSTVYFYDDPSGARAMTGYRHSDQWAGGAWLTKGDKAAVILAGIKGIGNTWYGYSDGTVWPDEGPWPPEPAGQRGWWSDSFRGQIIFYNPSDLAAVAEEKKESYEPQPYATLNIDDVLYNKPEDQFRFMGDVAFDRVNGILYIFEYLGDAAAEKSLVHVWKIR